MKAYYNEFDPKAAAWLRELIKAGLIADGDVDERSITDVHPNDLHGYTQCHFFCGIAGWPRALRLAGIPDDVQLWTGSCPCQPFSAAGKQLGAADERHLWPAFFRLIEACRPPVIFGEQVASAAVIGGVSGTYKRKAESAAVPVWLDGVFADLESAHYTCGAGDIPAAGVGAPHIRQRLFWVAYARHASMRRPSRPAEETRGRALGEATGCCPACGLADSDGGNTSAEREQCSREQRLLAEGRGVGGMAHADKQHDDGAGLSAGDHGGQRSESKELCGEQDRGLGDAASEGPLPSALPGVHRREESAGARHGEPERSGSTRWMGEPIQPRLEGHAGYGDHGNEPGRIGAEASGPVAATGGAWDSFDLLQCLDGKARRVESGTFPLVAGLPRGMVPSGDPSVAYAQATGEERVARLRGYGNSIVPQVAAEFIQASLEALSDA